VQFTRGFTGHEMLDEVSLINMVARIYDPATARFLSPDALFPGINSVKAFNPFAYCHNSPLMFTDPDGNEPVTLIIITCVVVGAYIGGTMANNGTLNPVFWKYDAKTFEYMAVGGLIGGVSGLAGASVAGGIYASMTYCGANAILAGAVSGFAGGVVSTWFSNAYQGLGPGRGVTNETAGDMLFKLAVGGIFGAAGGALAGLSGLPNINPSTLTPAGEAAVGIGVGLLASGPSAAAQMLTRLRNPNQCRLVNTI
jgi:RHS repeat-associated protein